MPHSLPPTTWAPYPISPALPLTPNLLHPLLYAWLSAPPFKFRASGCLHLWPLSKFFIYICNAARLWGHKRLSGNLILESLKKHLKKTVLMWRQIGFHHVHQIIVRSRHVSGNICIILLYSHSILVNQLIQNIIYNNTVLTEKEIYRNS